MREQYYQRRLINDLEEWVKLGRISQEHAQDIVDELPTSSMADRLPSIIAILGAVLICFGILAFVAANWYGVPKAARLALIAIGMWSAYGCAGVLYKRGSLWLFEAVVLIGVSIYIAGIVLVAQMYHMDGHYPDAIFLAGVGSLVAAWLVRSTGAITVGITMMTMWTHLEIEEFNFVFHWPFLIVWGVMAAVAYQLKSRIAYHMLTLSFAYWAAVTFFELSDRTLAAAVAPLAALAFLVLVIAQFFVLDRHKTDPDSFATPLSQYAVTGIIVLIFMLQIMEDRPVFASFGKPDATWIHVLWLASAAVLVGAGILIAIFRRQQMGYSAVDIAGLILIGVTAPLFAIFGVHGLIAFVPMAICLLLISLWLIVYGQNFNNLQFINLGFVLFGGETLYIYFKTFGSLMDSFIFFTIGGIVLIALAFGIDRFRKRILYSELEEAVE